MKKFINIVLSIIMIALIVLLCVNMSIKTMSTKAVTNAVVVQEASSGIEQVITQAFPNVSNENIAKVEEAVKNNSELNNVASELISQLTDIIGDGQQVDMAAIQDQLSKAVEDNIPAIEEALGQEITDEQKAKIQEKITENDGALQQKITSTVEKIQTSSPKTQQFIKTYKTLSDMPTRIICIIGIIVIIALMVLINKSFFKWALYSGIASVVSAILVGLLFPMIVKSLEFTIGTRILSMSIDIPVSSLNYAGGICGIIGVVLIIVYAIINRKNNKYERHYY